MNKRDVFLVMKLYSALCSHQVTVVIYYHDKMKRNNNSLPRIQM